MAVDLQQYAHLRGKTKGSHVCTYGGDSDGCWRKNSLPVSSLCPEHYEERLNAASNVVVAQCNGLWRCQNADWQLLLRWADSGSPQRGMRSLRYGVEPTGLAQMPVRQRDVAVSGLPRFPQP